MKTLLIVFCSRTGGTRQMAQAALRGASEHGALMWEDSVQGVSTSAVEAPQQSRVRLLEADEAGPEDVLAADGFIFATPENLAALPGKMKEFFDRCYYPVLDRLNGRPYATLICAGSDGENAARQIARIATGWRLRAVADPLIVRTNAQTPAAILAPKTIGAADLERCADCGAALAMGLMLGIY